MSTTTFVEDQTRATTAPVAKTGGINRGRWFTGFCISVLIVFAAIWLLPLVWAFVTSIRPEGEIAAHPASWWSNNFNFSAYRLVWSSGDMAHWYVNSAIVAVLSAVFAVVVGSMAGFVLSRMHFPGRTFAFWVILAGIMVPGQVLIVPLFREMDGFHLLNTYWGLILPAIPAPVAVFVFKQFFDGIPVELVESSRVDGASWWHIYARIVMPLARPALSAVAIFTFVWSWNAFLWPLLVMTSPDLMTIPVGLATVSSSYGIQYAQVMASAVLGALPLFVVFLIFQRQIVEGIAGTGLKG